MGHPLMQPWLLLVFLAVVAECQTTSRPTTTTTTAVVPTTTPAPSTDILFVVGVSLGGFFGFCILACLFYYCCIRKRGKGSLEEREEYTVQQGAQGQGIGYPPGYSAPGDDQYPRSSINSFFDTPRLSASVDQFMSAVKGRSNDHQYARVSTHC